MNAAPARAGTLMVAASAHTAIPARGRPSKAIATPAASRPTISTSLCPAAISPSVISGLSRASHSARAGSVPSDWARRGTYTANSTRPTSSRPRISSTPAIRCEPTMATITEINPRNSGP